MMFASTTRPLNPRPIEGLIDDVRIYDRVLSDEEVMALFKLQSDRESPKPEK